MSAFICDDKLFKALAAFHVSKSRDSGITSFLTSVDDIHEPATLAANTLHDENVTSVNARYGSSDFYDAVAVHVRDVMRPPVTDPVRILKACDCLEYQSCETGDAYYQSAAYKLLQTIRSRAIRALPGYDSAPWGI